MKVCAAGMLALLMMLFLCGASAQQQMRLYVQEGALDERQAQCIQALLESEFDQAQWTLEMGGTLSGRVLSDQAPDLAVCSPGEARRWAQEGLLIPLHLRIEGQARIQQLLLESCILDEELFMLPLLAQHRQMAVNRQLFDASGMRYFLDEQTYPAWTTAQFYQILEEFMMEDRTALDIWHAQPETSAAIEALAQALFGGRLLTRDGDCAVNEADMRGGVRFLADAVDDGLIGYCEDREAALARFMAGETAIFLDWTPAEAARQKAALAESGMEIVVASYPAAAGVPVRSYELAGVCAFESGDAARDALALDAAALLHQKAEDALGARGIWRDGAIWLWDPDAHALGATLRSMLCDALNAVMESGEETGAALERVQAAMDAME